MLLARMPEEGVRSGPIGQSLYMIIVADPSLEWSLERLILETFRSNELTWRSCWIKAHPFGPKWVRTDRDAVILPSLTPILHLSNDPQARLGKIVERMPAIMNISIFPEIAETVAEFGQFDIF